MKYFFSSNIKFLFSMVRFVLNCFDDFFNQSYWISIIDDVFASAFCNFRYEEFLQLHHLYLTNSDWFTSSKAIVNSFKVPARPQISPNFSRNNQTLLYDYIHMTCWEMIFTNMLTHTSCRKRPIEKPWHRFCASSSPL